MEALEYHTTPIRWTLCKATGFLSTRVFSGPLVPLRLVDRPEPELPGPGWVRLETILGGVCGTDLALIAQRNHPATILQCFAAFPAILGHENVATIDTVGSDVGDWRPGRRVCVEPALGCMARGAEPPCRRCAEGLTSLCEHPPDARLPARALVGLNAMTGGSWAAYFVAHESQLHAVPETLSDDAALLTDPIASATHAVLRRRPQDGETILVNGSGIIALGIIAAIRALDHANHVTAVVRHGFQADLAARLGASDILRHPRGTPPDRRYDDIAGRTGGRRVAARFGNQALTGGFDLTYDCTGTGRGLTDALKWTRSRGTVVAAGTTDITILDTAPLWFDEIQLIGANGRQIECLDGRRVHTYDLVLEWARDGRLDLSAIPVTRYPLAEYRTALRHLFSRGRNQIVKAAFVP